MASTEILALPGKELHLVLGGLVGAQQSVLAVVAAAVDGGGHDIVQAEDLLRPGGQQAALGAGAGVDVTGQHVLGVGQDGPGVIGEDDLHLRAALPDQVGIVVHIVHAREGVDGVAEQLPVTLQGEDILIGVHPLLVHRIHIDEVIAHLVGGVGQHQDDLLLAPLAMPRRQMAKRLRLRMGNRTPTVSPPSLARTSAAISSTEA